jgi:hypothetical protein
LRKDGIVHVHIKNNVTVDIDCQDEMEIIYWEITKEPRYFIYTAGQFLTFTKEAQRNAKEMEKRVPVIASALIVTNLAQRLIADFYYKMNKPVRPLKVFRNFDKGVEWLIERSKLQSTKEKM